MSLEQGGCYIRGGRGSLGESVEEASTLTARLLLCCRFTGTSIGKRYARTDEIGVPYALTVDYDTLNDKCVTLRERDSMTQVRSALTYVTGGSRWQVCSAQCVARRRSRTDTLTCGLWAGCGIALNSPYAQKAVVVHISWYSHCLQISGLQLWLKLVRSSPSPASEGEYNRVCVQLELVE